MSDINTTVHVGRLTRAPEMRYTAGGVGVCEFGIACNRKYKDKQEVFFGDCVAWGKLGEIVAEFAKKGEQIGVVGRLKTETWEKDGKKQVRVKIIAESVQLLGGRGKAAEPGAEREPAEPEPAMPEREDIPF